MREVKMRTTTTKTKTSGNTFSFLQRNTAKSQQWYQFQCCKIGAHRILVIWGANTFHFWLRITAFRRTKIVQLFLVLLFFGLYLDNETHSLWLFRMSVCVCVEVSRHGCWTHSVHVQYTHIYIPSNSNWLFLILHFLRRCLPLPNLSSGCCEQSFCTRRYLLLLLLLLFSTHGIIWKPKTKKKNKK